MHAEDFDFFPFYENIETSVNSMNKRQEKGNAKLEEWFLKLAKAFQS